MNTAATLSLDTATPNPLQLQLRRSEGRTPVGMAAQQHLLPWLAELSTEGLTVRVSPEEGLIGFPDDSSDLLDTIRKMSVKIVWNADSTFDASNADVSINESPFSALRDGGRVQRFRQFGETVDSREEGAHLRRLWPLRSVQRAGASNRSCSRRA